MRNFISAEKLKKKYTCFGHFFTINFNSNKSVKCRSVLEIVAAQEVPKEINELSHWKPDAVFIMMNPGSSLPLVEVNQTVHAKDIEGMSVFLVSAKPDITQYQIMRVMLSKGWKHSRILNLSDLRNPKSGNFISQFNEVDKFQNGQVHSIFSSLRMTELSGKLKKKNGAPLICAWGISPDLDPLIERFFYGMKNSYVLAGLKKEGTSDKYYHPLPTLQKYKEKWVKNILSQLCC